MWVTAPPNPARGHAPAAPPLAAGPVASLGSRPIKSGANARVGRSEGDDWLRSRGEAGPHRVVPAHRPFPSVPRPRSRDPPEPRDPFSPCGTPRGAPQPPAQSPTDLARTSGDPSEPPEPPSAPEGRRQDPHRTPQGAFSASGAPRALSPTQDPPNPHSAPRGHPRDLPELHGAAPRPPPGPPPTCGRAQQSPEQQRPRCHGPERDMKPARRYGARYGAGHGDTERGTAIRSRTRSGARRGAGSGFPSGDFQKRPASREGRSQSTWPDGAGLRLATPTAPTQCRPRFCSDHAPAPPNSAPSSARATPLSHGPAPFCSGHAPTFFFFYFRPRPQLCPAHGPDKSPAHSSGPAPLGGRRRRMNE